MEIIMSYESVRKELSAFYQDGEHRKTPVKAFADHCSEILNSRVTEDMSVMEQVMLQEKVITDEFEPTLFKTVPFYCETGALVSVSDGAWWAKNCAFMQAGGWTAERNHGKFREMDPELYALRTAHCSEKLYLICGSYNDETQHFNYDNRPVLKGGLKSFYKKAEALLPTAENRDEEEYLRAVMNSMLCLKRAGEKFSEKAEEMLKGETDPDTVKNLEFIRDTAKRVPWNAPETYLEALCTLAFMRKMIGTLEGIGPNTFGRIDKDLYSFYERDIKAGRLTFDTAYDVTAKFLLYWDCHYSHDFKFEGYADHELENTYVLGGCDDDGKPLYNDLTRMFLTAAREESIIFPKITCRFSANSPKEYLHEASKAVVAGNSSILYQNDDASIPAVLNSGKTLEEARDYLVTGCWDIALNGVEKFDSGCYLNLLKPFEFALHRRFDKMEKVQMQFETYDEAKTFEDVYRITAENSFKLMKERMEITKKGGHWWHLVTAIPIFSASMDNGIEKKRDFTYIRGKYNDDYLQCIGLPNIVDSLMAIKTLVFDKKEYTLEEYLTAVRQNFEGFEELRQKAIACSGWGDGKEESSALGNRFNNDLYEYAKTLTGSYGGRVHIGHLTYTEIRWWGEQTLATPDGRLSGDYFSQGLTPSRLKKIDSVTDVIRTMVALDPEAMGSNNVVNIILPSGKTDLDVCEAFLRSVAASSLMCLQLNVVSREQLLEARKNPEAYKNLIVRVTGFSARFTALSEGWQDEVLSRNYYS